MIMPLYSILSEVLVKFMKIMDWFKSCFQWHSWQLPSQLSLLFCILTACAVNKKVPIKTLCAFMKSKELFELPLVEWCMSPTEIGLHCCLYYPLYTAVICTVWIQTAVAVLLSINKALGSPFIFMCFLWYRKTVTRATGMLENLGSIWEASSSWGRILGYEHR